MNRRLRATLFRSIVCLALIAPVFMAVAGAYFTAEGGDDVFDIHGDDTNRG